MRAFARTTTLATLLAASAAALTGGCGRDATSPQDQLPGTYALRSVNGQPLPVVSRQDATGTYTIASNVLTFNSGGTLAEQATVLITLAGGGSPTTQSASVAGTWTFSADSVAVGLADGTHFTGAFSGGNTITVGAVGATLVYRK